MLLTFFRFSYCADLALLQSSLVKRERFLSSHTALKRVNFHFCVLCVLFLFLSFFCFKLLETFLRKQATLVDEHVLKLEIQKIQESVHKRAGKVLTLEKRREKLNTGKALMALCLILDLVKSSVLINVLANKALQGCPLSRFSNWVTKF